MTARARLHAVLALVLAAAALPACAEPPASDGEFLGCAGKCDSAGALTVSRRWIPAGGFLRVVVASGDALTVEPADGVTIEASGARHSVAIARPGFYTVVATKDGRAVGELKVRVSDEGPRFAVRAPAAGAFLTLPAGEATPLEGTVSDPLGEPLRLKMGATPLPLDEHGGFHASLATAFGVGFVELTATDVAGNAFVYSHGFLVAPRFGGGETQVDAAVSEELLDLVAAKLSPRIPSLIQVGAQPDPVADPLAHSVYFDGATLPGQAGNPGAIAVALDSHEGWLRTTMTARGDLIARAHVDNWVLPDTHIVATASDLAVDAAVAFAGLDADVTDLDVDFSNFDLQIGSIPGWLPGLFVEAVKGMLGRVIKGRVGPIVGDVLRSLEGDFQLSLVSPCLALETPFTLGYRLADIAPHEGRLALALGAEARSAGDPGPGAPWREERAAAAPAGGAMAVSVGGNLLNQFLYELWHAGALRLHLDESDLAPALAAVPALAGLDVVIDVKAELAAPPVVEPGEGGAVRVSFGELRLDIRLDAGVFQLGITANVGARADLALTIEDGAVRVVPAVRELHLDLGRQAFSGLNTEAVEALLRAIAPELVGRIAGSLEAFRLPEVDLASAGLPGVRLGIDSGSVAADSQGFTFSGRVSVLTEEPAASAGPLCRAL